MGTVTTLKFRLFHCHVSIAHAIFTLYARRCKRFIVALSSNFFRKFYCCSPPPPLHKSLLKDRKTTICSQQNLHDSFYFSMRPLTILYHERTRTPAGVGLQFIIQLRRVVWFGLALLQLIKAQFFSGVSTVLVTS